MNPATLVNVVLTAPLLATLIGLMVTRKVVFGWALDEQKRTAEAHAAEMRAGYERDVAARERWIAELRADLADANRELRETTPTLVRANDSLKQTQDLLREILRRSVAP